MVFYDVLKMILKWFSKRDLEKEMHKFCIGFGKCFPHVFCVWRPRGCRIVLVDPGGMMHLEKLITSLRLRSGNQDAKES